MPDRIKTTYEKTDRYFHGRYKGHEIEVEEEDNGEYYISVTGPDGSHAYCDFWSCKNIGEAILQSLEGAKLI